MIYRMFIFLDFKIYQIFTIFRKIIVCTSCKKVSQQFLFKEICRS